MNIDVNYFLKNQNEFSQVNREHDCEVPKGDLWAITVEHVNTGIKYWYSFEDEYGSLKDQVLDMGEDSAEFRIATIKGYW